jgi:hypothetical protein
MKHPTITEAKAIAQITGLREWFVTIGRLRLIIQWRSQKRTRWRNDNGLTTS